jgi:hypothetical protein
VEIFFSDKAKIKKSIKEMLTREQIREFPDPLNLKILEVQKQTLEKDENDPAREIEIQHLQFIKPTIHVYFSHILKQYELDIKNLRQRKLSFNFIGLLRHIMDAKYNEFLINQGSYKDISAFPDFFYSFTSRYILDEKTKLLR